MKRMQKKQAGFTILEIGIVMIILVSLVVAFSTGLWEKQRAADAGIVKLWFERNVPQAIASCRLKYGNIITGAGGVSAANLQSCGLESTTIFSSTVSWTSDSTTTDGQIVFTYPVTGAADTATMVSDIATMLTNSESPFIRSASVSGTSVVVTVLSR